LPRRDKGTKRKKSKVKISEQGWKYDSLSPGNIGKRIRPSSMKGEIYSISDVNIIGYFSNVRYERVYDLNDKRI
jgi:hypothetical protein|tara:strand:- start:41 stop:262 length:222 start_codon:yes stop_codon:yes gene_type:complete